MQFSSLSVLFLAFAVFSSADESAAITSTSAINIAPISSLLGSLASAVATASPASGVVPVQTANLSNIADPPSNLIPVIMTSVPMSVLGDLLDPASRSSLAAEFKNGTTPGWYQSLPTSIRSYISVVNSQINAGALYANTSVAVASSTSSGPAPAGAPMPTGALAVNMAGALGIAGLALIL